MEVLNSRVGLLSNYEVYILLKDLESEQTASPTPQPASDSLRFIQNESLKYLSDPVLPTTRQNEYGITSLLQQLEQFPTLTRAEKLMIVNMAPKTVVEIYVIVEELEDRLSEEDIETIISLVQSNLNEGSNGVSSGAGTAAAADQNGTDHPLFEDDDDENAKYEMEVAEQEELENADVGEEEGRGIDEVDD